MRGVVATPEEAARISRVVKHVEGTQTYVPAGKREKQVSRQRTIHLGKTDEAMTGRDGSAGNPTTYTVSIYTGEFLDESDTGENVEAVSFVDIDSGLWVNLIYRGGYWVAFPLECNA